MGNESSTEVVQDEAKFLEGLQGMCVSCLALCMYDRLHAFVFVLVRRSFIYLLFCFYATLMLLLLSWTVVRIGIASSGQLIAYLSTILTCVYSLLFRSLDDPDVKAVDEQVNAGTSWAVSYLYMQFG